MNKYLYKSKRNKEISGVCGGIAECFGFNATTLRILFVIFIGVTFWLYIVLLFLMPSDNMS